MHDWAEGDEGRNYYIRWPAGVKGWGEAVAVVFLLATVAGVLFAYLWIHGQISAVERQDQKVRSEMEAQLRVQGRLIWEEQALKNPKRIDAIARVELGMIPLPVNQIQPAPSADSRRAGLQEVALASIPGSILPK